MKRVAVLMSTYNGENYIREQIDSILKQEGVLVELIIRDDGSTDSTIDIIEKYKDVRLIKGRNVGPAKSFMELLINAPKTDYYAFADQDDIWDENKLFHAVQSLKDVNQPAVSIGSFRRIDKQGNYIDKEPKVQDGYTLSKTIVYNAPLGCTMLFNYKLKSMIKNDMPRHIRMHDHWILMLVEAVDGQIIYNKNSLVLYRQHDNNVVGNGIGAFKRIQRLMYSIRCNKNERQLQASEMLTQYYDLITDDAKNLLIKVCNYRNSLRTKINLIRDSRFRKLEGKKRMLFYLSVILGVF